MRWLLLDLAGVMADFDSAGRVARLAAGAGLRPDRVRERIYDSGFVADADAGRLDADEVLAGLRERLEWPGGDDELAALWAGAFSTAHDAVAAVAGLRAARPDLWTGLLTNNDALLARVLLAVLPDVWGLLDAGAFFAGALGVAKPAPGAWQAVLDHWSATGGRPVRPADVTFVDDSGGHVAAARELGLSAVHVTDPGALARWARGEAARSPAG